MKQRILPLLLLLVMMLLFVAFFYRWKQSSLELEQEGCAAAADNEEQEKQPPLVSNENYIPCPQEEKLEIHVPQPGPSQPQQQNGGHLQEWVKHYSEQLMIKFKIDHAHQEIFKAIHDFIMANTNIGHKMEESDLVYIIFSQCPSLSVSKKMEMAVYVIWKSRRQEQINHVYDVILSIAADNQENPKVRANALEILMRSNNNIYMDRSKRIMANLQEHEKVQEMAQILQRMERIQTAMRQQQQPAPTAMERAVPLTPYQQVHQLNNQPPPLTPEEQQVQQALLDQYRRLERRAFNAMNKKATVYDDTQNVHNHTINETVIASAQNIMDHAGTPSPMVHVERELQQYYPQYEKHKEKIQSSLNRIRSDPSKFRGDTTIAQVFDRVVSFISTSRHKQEMWRRLGEELVEMNQLCATGHLSRIVNVIQGFDDVPQEFQIKMDPKDEIFANLSNYITMNVQESGQADKLLESMIDPEDRSLFIGFVCIILKPKVEELRKEYQGIVEPQRLLECIHASIRNYIKNDKETETIWNSLQV
jgi:hypothetical protein